MCIRDRYLIAFEINEDLMEEIARLNRAFGIGIILLSPYTDATKELFPARRNELDYYTIDKLCRINADYKSFINKATSVLNAQKEMCIRDRILGGYYKRMSENLKENDMLEQLRDTILPKLMSGELKINDLNC